LFVYIAPLTTYFTGQPPYQILFAFRGPASTRYIVNLDSFINTLYHSFPSPTYHIELLNTSVIGLDFQTQLYSVASSYVVIANHGAFEGNMIYMKNSSLLIEIFGHYGNNEIHTFHHLALVFGLYYARIHAKNMTDHLQSTFYLQDENQIDIVNTIQEYFQRKAYQVNTLITT
jgi:hypothetical protein